MRQGKYQEALAPYAEALGVFRASLGADTVEATVTAAGIFSCRLT